MYFVGEFSKMGKTTVKTLHYYDRVGLLKPEAIDEETGYRLYTTRQLVELHRIQSLRQAGLSVEEIRQVFVGADLKQILERRYEEIACELHEREGQLARIKFMLSDEEKEFSMDYQATIKDIPSYTVYSKRLTVPNYQAYFEVIPAIGKEVVEANPGLKCTTPEYCYVVYLDGEYKETDINIEYNEAVTSVGKDTGDIHFRKTDPVRVVSVMHKGGYAGLPKAYAFALGWVEQNGYTPVDFVRESYIDGIWNKDDEADWLTEVQVPIEKIS